MRTIFSKTDAHFFRKKLFSNISVVSAILVILSLEKKFIENRYYLLNFAKKKVFNFQKQSSETVLQKEKKTAHKILPKFTCNLILL